MNDSRADDVIRSHEFLKGRRGNFESIWQQTADRIYPRASDFVSKKSRGESRTEKIFDSTSALSLERFGAALHSLMVPSTSQWHEMSMPGSGVEYDIETQRFLDMITKIMFRARYNARANFSSQIYEVFLSLGAFGTGILFTDEIPGQHLYYKAIHLAEMYIAENSAGRIDTFHREYEYTAHQIVDRFKMLDNLPELVKRAYEKQDRNSRFKLIHCVKPNPEIIEGRRDFRGMPFVSYDVLIDGRVILRESGYRTSPYQVARYTTSPREVYGRGPATLVLPDIKMLNEIEKTTIRSGHIAVNPPILLTEDGGLSGFNATPGALNHGGLDDQGRAMAQPFNNGANLPWGIELADQKRRTIQDAFLVTLFQILVETPTMTATEALLRAQEKGALLAPTKGRMETELLGPMIDREADLLARAGQFPEEAPESVIEAGGELEIKYTSPLSRMMRSEDGVAILRSIEQLAPLAQLDPKALRRINPDKALKELWEINGAPASVLFTDDELAAMDEAESAQIEAQQMLQAAPVAASAAKDMALAQQIAGQSPTNVQAQLGA
jgi:hypothetical protein